MATIYLGTIMSLRVKLGLAALAITSAAIVLAQGTGIQPGEWEMTSTTKAVEMPNAPPQVAQMMAGRSTSIRHCITPQDALNGGREMMKANKSCTFSRYEMSAGKLEAEMTCSQGGGTMTAVTSGTYTATTMASTSHMVVNAPAPMTITTSMTGKRVGSC